MNIEDFAGVVGGAQHLVKDAALHGALAGSLVSPLLGLAVGLGTDIGRALYNTMFAPKPKPFEKSLINTVKKQGGKVVAEAAAAFLDTGKHASSILKSNGFKAAATLVGANPTIATIATILAGAGVSYAIIRKFKNAVSRKGGQASITRRHSKRTRSVQKTLTKLSKPASLSKSKSRSRPKRSTRKSRSTRRR